LLDGIDGARIWCGYDLLAHDLDRVAGLVQAKQAKAA